MELKLKNITSYDKVNFTKIPFQSKISIIYGQNGTGKSTISNYFYSPADEQFKSCECDDIDRYKFLVYNQKFIEDNFYNETQQKGVFTLSKENADVEKKIDAKEKIRIELLDELKLKKEKITQLQNNLNAAKTTCVESVWSKTDSIRNSKLSHFMKGSLNSKQNFFNNVSQALTLPPINLHELEVEYEDITAHRNSEIPHIPTPFFYCLSSDDIEALKTPIIDTSNSYLSEVIDKLKNLDWVKKGMESFLTEEKCPFCQEMTINERFKKALTSIFDESYEKKIAIITAIKNDYITNSEHKHEALKNAILSCVLLSDEDKNKIDAYINLIINIETSNIHKITSKIASPSLEIILDRDEQTEISIINDVSSLNIKITETNAKTKRYKEVELEIKRKIWSGIKEYCKPEFDIYTKSVNKNNQEIKPIESEVEMILTSGTKNSEEIKELRKQISNIELTRININSKLKNLGISGFEIIKHNSLPDHYVLARGEGDKTVHVYRSLSEGEKTLITFLYFLECCKGKTDKQDNDSREQVIVIDDPISSLSHNYVYDIASIIHYEIIKTGKSAKVIILTHNLYFFHELIKIAPKAEKAFNRDYSLYRVTKNKYSSVDRIDRKILQNEYQALWETLKDARTGRVNKFIIPNIMRNILEYYFAFVHKTDELQEELNKLAQDEANLNFRAFYRYINRGSHSDSINISDIGDIEPDVYLEQLKKIFNLMGDEIHYVKMIGENEEVDVTA